MPRVFNGRRLRILRKRMANPEQSSLVVDIFSHNDLVARRSKLIFDETFTLSDQEERDAAVVTAITPDWLNARSPVFNAAGSGAITLGVLAAGTSSLTVDNPEGWRPGHGIRIEGAGQDGNPLITTVNAIHGRTIILAGDALNSVRHTEVSHDDTAAVQSLISAGSSEDRTVFLPAGTYNVEALSLNSPNSLHIIGAGPGCTILRSRDDNPILQIDTSTATAHSITIEGISFVGSHQLNSPPGAAYRNNDGLFLRDTGGHGLFNITIRNCRFEKCGNTAIRTSSGANAIFTVLLEGLDISQPSAASGNAIDLYGSNDLTFIRCYVHEVANGQVAYRVRSGAPVFIGCNGIDGGLNASWGLFGQNHEEDGATTYVRATLIGCNVEDFTNYAIRCKAGSTASFFNTRIIAPAAGEVTPIRFDFVGENQAGIFDGQSSIERKNSAHPLDDTGYANNQAIHSDGLPFIQIGNRGRATFYDLNGETVATLPGLTGTRVTGSSHYALTSQGYAKFTGPLAIESQHDPVASPAGTGLLYASPQVDGSIGLFWQTNGTSLHRLDHPETVLQPDQPGKNELNVEAGQIAFGQSLNSISGSDGLTYDEATRVLTLSRSGGNPFILVSDTANSIDLRFGTLAGAPDRGIIGTLTDHQFVLYQNGGEAWGMNSTKHWTPFAGDNLLDLGTPNARVRDGYFARHLLVGGDIRATGAPLTAAPGPGAGIMPEILISGTSLAGKILLRTGQETTPDAAILDLALPSAASNSPVVIITPANAAAASLGGQTQVFVDDRASSISSWRLSSGAGPLEEATEYYWYFQVVLI